MENKPVFTQPVTKLIRKRFSCRTYLRTALSPAVRQHLESAIHDSGSGPFGNRARFRLAAITSMDHRQMRGLGTYGFIKDATAFLIGAIRINAPRNLEDYGYLMERIILTATDAGLGTCWLGGTFTKSTFSRKIDLQGGELVPAVTAVGYPAANSRWMERLIRQGANAERRLPGERLFFENDFQSVLSLAAAGDYALPLEMVRLGPSASNKQPWRVVKENHNWHFYLKRTPGYHQRRLVRLFTVADLQRVDMGIAMCHFELAVHEQGLSGYWVHEEPARAHLPPETEYTATWREDRKGR